MTIKMVSGEERLKICKYGNYIRWLDFQLYYSMKRLGKIGSGSVTVVAQGSFSP